MNILNIKSFFRFLWKNKEYSSVTIIGYSISLCFFLLLTTYVQKEFSVDSFHQNKERIYRVTNDIYPSFSSPCGPLIKEKVKGVEEYCRIFEENATFSVKQRKYSEMMMMVDETFFQMFDYSLIRGDKQSVLATKNSLLLSNSYAKELFQHEDPIGKIISIGEKDVVVSGVYDDFRGNTAFKPFKMICNYEMMRDFWGDYFMDKHANNSAELYLLAQPGYDLTLECESILAALKEDNHWVYTGKEKRKIFLEPLQDIHFSNRGGCGVSKQVDKSFVLILLTISILILLLATINYINLTNSRAMKLSKSIAVHKLIGSTNGQAMWNMINESMLLCVLSTFIGIFLAILCEPLFLPLVDSPIGFGESLSVGKLVGYLLFAVVWGILFGFFPALAVRRSNAIDVVRGNGQVVKKQRATRLLIGLQYVSGIFLLIASGTILLQTNYLRNYNVGFNKDRLICIDNNAIEAKQANTIKNRWLALAGVENVAAVCGTPIDGGNNNTVVDDDGKQISFQVFKVDSSYFDMMNHKVTLTGAAYDKDAVILNRAAIRELALEANPTSFSFGKSSKNKNYEKSVYGVVEDYHFKDLKTKIGSSFLSIRQEEDYPWSFLIKVKPSQEKVIIGQLENEWHKMTEGAPMEWEYVDQTLRSWYDDQEHLAKLIAIFLVLTLFISIMGNYAMAIYYSEGRQKEVGVRRVNGATEIEILHLLNRDFLLWIAIAFVIAAPVGYIACDYWLAQFAYHISVQWWVVVTAGLVMLIIALVSVSSQTLVASRRNPSDILRSE